MRRAGPASPRRPTAALRPAGLSAQLGQLPLVRLLVELVLGLFLVLHRLELREPEVFLLFLFRLFGFRRSRGFLPPVLLKVRRERHIRFVRLSVLFVPLARRRMSGCSVRLKHAHIDLGKMLGIDQRTPEEIGVIVLRPERRTDRRRSAVSRLTFCVLRLRVRLTAGAFAVLRLFFRLAVDDFAVFRLLRRLAAGDFAVLRLLFRLAAPAPRPPRRR